jgi:transposase
MQIAERGYSVIEVAGRLGAGAKTLYQWRSDLRGSPKDMKSTDNQAEIARLKSAYLASGSTYGSPWI